MREPRAPQGDAPTTWTTPLQRALVAEFVGTASLLLVVVGSGIMAENLGGDPGLQLLENAIATGAALAALILAFGSVSGAHFNPAVSITDAFFGGITVRVAALYCAVERLLSGFVARPNGLQLFVDYAADLIERTKTKAF